ncbi:MAG: hypothetical protein A3C84_03515 [Candidatus Ryanbacteria bacterium RIFCSPHIGHO2_02_FULL_48_12]|uniref:Uncharacterized protein n=1 Tax=Candidatus Ryanbacteria bacterium RIFCSPHIGHO2_01_FULL_48_27 TaxID=1802115 RepID=A0A1G2G6K6_9BACT|nr:MAG: hypothetical protein A2756_02885 [Candidatus Ryanbacteria bacterium RIFCSPHIGHO2_01_FULL_48_27]OGZ49412.1 MAG: hypothetical protein A3C84_03515 [Candidatus Ryanbacteria bacterium RIFCSPHIGHO2_02_FULL_48_12]
MEKDLRSEKDRLYLGASLYLIVGVVGGLLILSRFNGDPEGVGLSFIFVAIPFFGACAMITLVLFVRGFLLKQVPKEISLKKSIYRLIMLIVFGVAIFVIAFRYLFLT